MTPPICSARYYDWVTWESPGISLDIVCWFEAQDTLLQYCFDENDTEKVSRRKSPKKRWHFLCKSQSIRGILCEKSSYIDSIRRGKCTLVRITQYFYRKFNTDANTINTSIRQSNSKLIILPHYVVTPKTLLYTVLSSLPKTFRECYALTDCVLNTRLIS